MEITKDIVYLGVNDHAVDLFESQYSVPNGMAYNSYLIMDDQTVVMDTVDAHFTDEWITKIAAALGDRAPDYLVVQHMEPDHAGSIDAFAQAYPTTKIVSSAKAFVMMQQFFGTDYADRRHRRQGRRHSAPGPSHPALRHRPHGPLAGSHHDLRRCRQSSVQR